jgi:hypothetical protein
LTRWFPILLLACSLHGEVIDRIAVSVGNQVITQSDIEREIRITAFLNGEPPDFSPRNKRATAGRLVDQLLVRSELESSGYPMPSAAEADAALRTLKSHFPSEAAYRRALSAADISENELQDRLAWQLTLVRFIDVRFRPGIQISEEAIRNYFNEHLRTLAAEAHPGSKPSLDTYHDEIEQTLISQAANQQVEQWLSQARKRARIEYREDAFQ